MSTSEGNASPFIDPDAWVAPDATVAGDVRICAGSRIMNGARLVAEGGGTAGLLPGGACFGSSFLDLPGSLPGKLVSARRVFLNWRLP